MTKRKPLPLFFLGLSLLYLIYVVSMGDSRIMGGGTEGDPGAMMLPLFLAVFMFAASAYLFITDTTTVAREKTGKPEKGLFVFTLALSVAYILLMGTLGFILCTCFLLFCLCFTGSRGGFCREDLKTGGLWLLFSLLFQITLYSLGRYVSRALMMMSRSGSVPAWVGNTGFLVLAVSLVLAGICFLTILTLRKPISKASIVTRHAWVSALVAVITTQALYLVFRQLFLVQLAQGLITW